MYQVLFCTGMLHIIPSTLEEDVINRSEGSEFVLPPRFSARFVLFLN